jgi:1,2-phenylacetyl-CoA epoxidase catalytic subunit
MWFDRLQDEPRFVAALERLRPQTEALLDSAQRGEHTAELGDLWQEMTIVRRSQPVGTKW